MEVPFTEGQPSSFQARFKTGSRHRADHENEQRLKPEDRGVDLQASPNPETRQRTKLNAIYAVVIESGQNNYSAYVPDLPGCVPGGDTLDEVKQMIQEAIELHIEGMREDGLAIPEPSIQVAMVEVAA